MSNPEQAITRDKIEAICYRYLCGARVRVEFAKDDDLEPIYILTGKGVREIEDKIQSAKDTFMSNMKMEEGLFELERYTEKLKNFLTGGES